MTARAARAPDDAPRGASYWAARWNCHRNTSRKLLRHLRRTHGAAVVWQVGPQRRLVATEASLRAVLGTNGKADSSALAHDPDDLVTRDQLAAAAGEIWKAIREHSRLLDAAHRLLRQLADGPPKR